MSGYRDTSNFDPYAGPNYGRPLRPFNWVQWTGVFLIVIGALAALAYILGSVGVIPWKIHDALPFILLASSGSILVNSRREEVSPEFATERRRKALIALALAVVIFAAVLTAILVSKGA